MSCHLVSLACRKFFRESGILRLCQVFDFHCGLGYAFRKLVMIPSALFSFVNSIVVGKNLFGFRVQGCGVVWCGVVWLV